VPEAGQIIAICLHPQPVSRTTGLGVRAGATHGGGSLQKASLIFIAGAEFSAVNCNPDLMLVSNPLPLFGLWSEPMILKLKVNNAVMTVDVSPDTPLLWVLRDVLDLKGAK
jgi:hypothetical protein